MKTPLLVAFMVVSWPAFWAHAAPLTPSAAPSPEIQELLNEGKAAYAHGDMAKAKADFEMVYQIDSRNQIAIGYLRLIKSTEKNSPKTVDQEQALAAINIPKIEFREATLREALDFLRKKAADLSNGKQSVNFVVPGGEATDSIRVTLSLQNIPFPEAVRYIGRVTNFKFTFEKYAIVGTPAAGAAPEPGPGIPQGGKPATPPAQ